MQAGKSGNFYSRTILCYQFVDTIGDGVHFSVHFFQINNLHSGFSIVSQNAPCIPEQEVVGFFFYHNENIGNSLKVSVDKNSHTAIAVLNEKSGFIAYKRSRIEQGVVAGQLVRYPAQPAEFIKLRTFS